ncbi:MAG TPA: glycosyltransferase family 2 protein [Candidatus Acidoferrum sp.]|jgi:glycosyltransferase involved in cell wall biosynthesis|nr:glycosyltransferase family 2 protein [Candidatus Acidoferrum sp.]
MSGHRPKLSLAMIVKNEARCLARCLHSIKQVVDEIVIVDTGSKDDTVKIATEFDGKISHFDWINDFSAARNFALERAGGDWILVLDADEFASEALGKEIREFILSEPAIGRLKIVSDFRRNGQTLRSQSFVSRLFPRGPRFQGGIHEQIVSTLPRINLRGELWHDGYLETQKSDRNTKLLQAELKREPGNVYLLYQLAIEYNSLEQVEKAFQCLQKAFAGIKHDEPFAPNITVDLLYAAMALKKFEVASEAIAKSERFLEDFPDFHLARGLFYMNLIRSNASKHIKELPKIEQSFQRCLALGETDKYKSVHGSGTFLANYNLGVFYHAFGNAKGAQKCFEAAASQDYEPAATMLKKIK